MSSTVISAVVLGADGLPEGHEGVEDVVKRLDRIVWGRGQFGRASGVEGAKLGGDGALGTGAECIALAEGAEGGGDGGERGRGAGTGGKLLEGRGERARAGYEVGVVVEGREIAGAGGADSRGNQGIGLVKRR